MSVTDEASTQLAEQISYWLERAEMYGLAEMRRNPDVFARQVVGDLTSGDRNVAAQAAQTAVEWSAPGFDPPPQRWWSTPLGRLVAQVAPDAVADDGTISVKEAAAVLGLSRWRIYQLLDEGRLKRGPGRGEIIRASVGRELATRDVTGRDGETTS